MRVAIIHNTTAGARDHSTGDLAQRLRVACGDVRVHGRSHDDVAEALRESPDLLVVAGGDGTVAKAVRHLFELDHEPRVPLLILPIGTANNLARSLRISGNAEDLVREVNNLESVRLDVGRVEASWGSTLFAESVGIGPLGTILDGERSAVIRLTRAVREKLRPKSRRFEKRVDDFAREVERAKVLRLEISADGEDLSGEYILAEVMNIRTIGPLVPLAPHADPGDAKFDLLHVAPTDRQVLTDYVRRASGPTGDSTLRPPGISRRVREVTMSWPKVTGHVDDRAWPEKSEWSSGVVRVTKAGSIEARRPQQSPDSP